MNSRSVITLFAGIVLSGAAVLLVARELNNRVQAPAQAAPAPKVDKVVVAAMDIAFGSEIAPVQLALASWPTGTQPQGSFSTIDDVIGKTGERRVALRPMVRGEPVLTSKVSGFGGKATMSAVVPDGKRAFAIRVNDVSGVAGFLTPGDRVDVILTRNPSGNGDDDRVSHVILQNIIVRGTDQTADTERNKPQLVRTVTLEVTPEEAQKLALAMQVGQLSLALRNIASIEEYRLRAIHVMDLVNEQPKPPAPVAAPPPVKVDPTVRVRRGTAVTVSTVSF